jgi:hypothetical protein
MMSETPGSDERGPAETKQRHRRRLRHGSRVEERQGTVVAS